jgi:hypothetical protein
MGTKFMFELDRMANQVLNKIFNYNMEQVQMGANNNTGKENNRHATHAPLTGKGTAVL